jgi:hypothetical protein
MGLQEFYGPFFHWSIYSNISQRKYNAEIRKMIATPGSVYSELVKTEDNLRHRFLWKLPKEVELTAFDLPTPDHYHLHETKKKKKQSLS